MPRVHVERLQPAVVALFIVDLTSLCDTRALRTLDLRTQRHFNACPVHSTNHQVPGTRHHIVAFPCNPSNSERPPAFVHLMLMLMLMLPKPSTVCRLPFAVSRVYLQYTATAGSSPRAALSHDHSTVPTTALLPSLCPRRERALSLQQAKLGYNLERLRRFIGARTFRKASLAKPPLMASENRHSVTMLS